MRTKLLHKLSHRVELASAITNVTALLWWAFDLLIAPGYFDTNKAYWVMHRVAPDWFYAIGGIFISATIVTGIITNSIFLRVLGKALASFAWSFTAYSLFVYSHNSPGVAVYAALVIGNLVAVCAIHWSNT